MHIIQYRLVIVVLICGFLLLINGCGKNPVTFVSDDMDSTEEAAGAAALLTILTILTMTRRSRRRSACPRRFQRT